MTRLKISLYPNGELRAILSREKGFSNFFDTKKSLDTSHAASEDSEVFGEESGGKTPPLDNTSKLSVSQKPGYGGIPTPTIFGNNARRTLARSAGAIEASGIPPDQCLFLTGTIPGSTKECFDAMARWSSWAVKVVKTFISDCGVTAGLSMYCWEFQKRGALHLHYFVHVPCPEISGRIRQGWKHFWSGLIDGIGSRAGCDMWERSGGSSWNKNKGVLQADAQIVLKSVGRYLAKYLGKQAPRAAGFGKGGGRFLGPVRWWGVSRPLLALLREKTSSFEIDGIGISQLRAVAGRISRVISEQCDICYTYEDDSRSCLVILGYGSESSLKAFNILYRDFRYGIILNTFDF